MGLPMGRAWTLRENTGGGRIPQIDTLQTVSTILPQAVPIPHPLVLRFVLTQLPQPSGRYVPLHLKGNEDGF